MYMGSDMGGMDMGGAQAGIFSQAMDWLLNLPEWASAVILTFGIILCAVIAGWIIGKIYISIRYPNPEKPQYLTPLQKLLVLAAGAVIVFMLVTSFVGDDPAVMVDGDMPGDMEGMPGDIEGMPGDMEGMPGDIEGMPGEGDNGEGEEDAVSENANSDSAVIGQSGGAATMPTMPAIRPGMSAGVIVEARPG